MSTPWPGVVEWRSTDHPLYAVSNTGTVVSFAKQKPKAIKQSLRRDGYLTVDLTMAMRGRAVHRIVAKAFGVDCSADIDHVNRIRTDNRLENLRPASRSQNLANSSRRNGKHPFRGINKKGSRYRSQITANGTNHYLGTYKTIEEAAEAYNRAAVNIHGRFAVLNEV